MHVEVTSLQFFVGQAGVFAPEHQGDLFAPLGVLHRLGAALARANQRPGDAALAGAGTHHQVTADQRLFKAVDHLGVIQHIVGARGAALASRAGKSFGCTSTRRDKPMFFMARAAPPMLPGWLVLTRTTRIFCSKVLCSQMQESGPSILQNRQT